MGVSGVILRLGSMREFWLRYDAIRSVLLVMILITSGSIPMTTLILLFLAWASSTETVSQQSLATTDSSIICIYGFNDKEKNFLL